MIFDYFSSQLYKFSNNFRLAIRIKLPSFYGGGGGIRPLLEQRPPRVAAYPWYAVKSHRDSNHFHDQKQNRYPKKVPALFLEKVSRFDRKTLRRIHRLFRGGNLNDRVH